MLQPSTSTTIQRKRNSCLFSQFSGHFLYICKQTEKLKYVREPKLSHNIQGGKSELQRLHELRQGENYLLAFFFSCVGQILGWNRKNWECGALSCERLSQRKVQKKIFFSVLLHITNGILLRCPWREFSNYLHCFSIMFSSD